MKNDSPFGPDYNVNNSSKSNKYNDDVLNSMAYNSYSNPGSTGKEEIFTDTVCKVEKDIADFEFELNLNKSKDCTIRTSKRSCLACLFKGLLAPLGIQQHDAAPTN